MKKISFLIFCLCVLILAGPMNALGENPGEMTVNGNASVALAADGCVLRLGVETENTDVAAAQRENARIMDNVIAALRDLGAVEDDLVTTELNVYSYTRYDTDENGREKRTDVYHVGNTLLVTIRDVKRAGEMIDAGVSSGANQLYGLTFTASGSAEAYDRALEAACADAFRKAKVTAAACGVKLGAVKEIRLPDIAQASPDSRGLYKLEANADTAAGTYVKSGDIIVRADIEIVFSIIPEEAAPGT